MKNGFLLLLSASLFFSVANANEQVYGSSFTAPTINGYANVTNPQYGDIIYDYNATAFMGYNQAGSWVALGPAAYRAPTISTVTTSSHTGGFNGSGTYTTPTSPSPVYIRVRMVGGGGGGGGSGTGGPTTGGTGGNTTFGTSLLSATGAAASTGGSATVSSPAVQILAQTGSKGSFGGASYFNNTVNNQANVVGGIGGSSPFQGAGVGSATGTGNSANANTGSGGGGAGIGIGGTGGTYTGAGGGSGGFVDAIISAPSATYSYTVGAGGSGGSAGTSGSAGGTGGAGYIEVTEYYQ